MENFDYTISIGQLVEQLTLNQRAPGMRSGAPPVAEKAKRSIGQCRRAVPCGESPCGNATRHNRVESLKVHQKNPD